MSKLGFFIRVHKASLFSRNFTSFLINRQLQKFTYLNCSFAFELVASVTDFLPKSVCSRNELKDGFFRIFLALLTFDQVLTNFSLKWSVFKRSGNVSARSPIKLRVRARTQHCKRAWKDWELRSNLRTYAKISIKVLSRALGRHPAETKQNSSKKKIPICSDFRIKIQNGLNESDWKSKYNPKIPSVLFIR